MTRALIIFAEGAEDIETVAPADILTRGGVEVTLAALSDASLEVRTSHGLTVKADILLKDAEEGYDAVIVPGGYKGACNCRDSELVGRVLRAQKKRGGLIAAICAGPGFVLARHGILDENTPATGYPGTTDEIRCKSEEDVVVDPVNRIITARGPAFACKFGLTVLAVLKDTETAERVAGNMLFGPNALA